MNHIKFRAWDIPTRRMMDVVRLYFRLDYRERIDGPVSGVSVQGDGLEDLLNWKLMQYTGLKDKNDREIYEGDIVRSSLRADIEIWVVEIDPLTAIRSPQGMAFDNSWIEHEVIGNVFENPELLKENNEY